MKINIKVDAASNAHLPVLNHNIFKNKDTVPTIAQIPNPYPAK